MNKFRFYIDGNLVHPSYKMSQAREWTREEDQAYFRPSLTDPFIILDPDYSIIENEDIEHEFTFICEELTSTAGPTWTNFFTGYFTKFDFDENDEDHRIITLKPLPNDRYRKLIDGLEREINIVDLAIQKTSIKYDRHPILQIYFEGFNSSRVWNYSGSSFWETVTSERLTVTSKQQMLDSGFHPYIKDGEDHSTRKRTINVYGTGLSTDVTGKYVLQLYPDPPNDPEAGVGNTVVVWLRTDGLFFISSITNTDGKEIGWTLTETAGDIIFWNSTAPNSAGQEDPSGNILKMFGDETTHSGEVIQLEAYKIMTRILSDTDNTFLITELPEDNIIESFGRKSFKTTTTFAINEETIYISRNTTTTDQGFGKVVEPAVQYLGDFYTKPTFVPDAIPVLKNFWRDTSLWVYVDQSLTTSLNVFIETIELKDAYRIDRVIFALLQEIDPLLTHSNIPAFSNFLYNPTNPLSSEAQGQYYLTDKSNIIKPDYDKAATKIIVKLKDLLRAQYLIFFGLQYDITNLLNFRMEHKFFYNKGLSYSSDLIGADITSLIDPHSLKPWSTNTKKTKPEKPDVPGFIKREWLDDVSDFFNGVEIEILSKYADKKNRDDESIPLIVTDLNYISSNPSGVSKDGLVMLEVDSLNRVKYLEKYNPSIQVTQSFQNGSLAMTVLQERFARYELPARNAKINGIETTAITLKKTMKQEIRIKLAQYLQPEKLLLTSKGKGTIETLRQFMRTGENRITVRQDSEI